MSYFGHIQNGQMQLSKIGQLAHNFWNEIPKHFPHILLDAFIIMPNHMHGILIIPPIHSHSEWDGDALGNRVQTLQCNVSSDADADGRGAIPHNKMGKISPNPGSISTIIRSYKSATTKYARKINPNFGWQPRFYDHIIRDKIAYENIQNYINKNPQKWK